MLQNRMNSIYENIKASVKTGEKLLAILIDPDKFEVDTLLIFLKKIEETITTHIFVGGSEVADLETELLVEAIKKKTALPVLLFPGDVNQITDMADGILFLSLISGRNPDYLIGKHIEAVSRLKETTLEIIPTGYMLFENDKQTAVERVSETKPLKRKGIELIKNTAKAGELLGLKLIYREAGSGATHPIEKTIISQVKAELNIPLIVGGGIKTKHQLDNAYSAGADLVVIGTAFEEDENFFNEIKN